jgi:hypothetical protein
VTSLLGIGLLSGCVTPDIGGPVAPRWDENAGLLTLSSGRTVAVYPADLAYSGDALYRWPDGREYDGSWRNGKPDGMGQETRPDGERYRGTWAGGKRVGHGELNRSDGSRYVGDFAEGVREGIGSERSAAGLYHGDWADDLPNGEGEYFGNDGASYRGQWRNGLRDGSGFYDDGQGNSYDGDWTADSPNGFGVMANADGSVYDGQLTSNLRNGYGRLESGGFSYEGTWLAGKRHGYGRAVTPDGSEYLGGWENGNRHGYGRASWADGGYHDGEWQHDQPLGPGIRVDAAGIEISGVWNQDLITNALVLLPGGGQYAGSFMKRDGSVSPRLIDWLSARASAGDGAASLFLGRIYSDYSEPQPDPERALGYFLHATAAGIAEAAYRAALLTPEGDPAQRRIRLLVEAAGNGYAPASALLGEYYAVGRYVARDTSVAITYLGQASDRGDLTARNNLAWILATYPDSMLRDGERALELIQPIARLYSNWRHLDTLAASYAELGDFELAATTQQQALDNFRDSRSGTDLVEIDQAQLDNMAERLALYQQGRKFREYGDSRDDSENSN